MELEIRTKIEAGTRIRAEARTKGFQVVYSTM
jgi:hypothetical protein